MYGLALNASECSTGEMEAAATAMIAVIGTLLGAVLSYLFQRRASDHQFLLNTEAARRQERLDAYAAYGGAAVRFRLAALDVWHRADENASDEVQRRAKAKFYRLRAELVDAEIRVRLVSADARLDPLMSEVVHTASQIPKAKSAAERTTRSDAWKAAIERFLAEASSELGNRASLSQLAD